MPNTGRRSMVSAVLSLMVMGQRLIRIGSLTEINSAIRARSMAMTKTKARAKIMTKPLNLSGWGLIKARVCSGMVVLLTGSISCLSVCR